MSRPEEAHVTEIIERALGEQLRAFVRIQFKPVLVFRCLGFRQASEMEFESGFHSVRTRAVRPSLHFKLFDPDGCPDLEYFAPIVALRDAGLVGRVVGPALEQASDIERVTHRHLLSLSLF